MTVGGCALSRRRPAGVTWDESHLEIAARSGCPGSASASGGAMGGIPSRLRPKPAKFGLSSIMAGI